jgi:hypothetical protein
MQIVPLYGMNYKTNNMLNKIEFTRIRWIKWIKLSLMLDSWTLYSNEFEDRTEQRKWNFATDRESPDGPLSANMWKLELWSLSAPSVLAKYSGRIELPSPFCFKLINTPSTERDQIAQRRQMKIIAEQFNSIRSNDMYSNFPLLVGSFAYGCGFVSMRP